MAELGRTNQQNGTKQNSRADDGTQRTQQTWQRTEQTYPERRHGTWKTATDNGTGNPLEIVE